MFEVCTVSHLYISCTFYHFVPKSVSFEIFLLTPGGKQDYHKVYYMAIDILVFAICIGKCICLFLRNEVFRVCKFDYFTSTFRLFQAQDLRHKHDFMMTPALVVFHFFPPCLDHEQVNNAMVTQSL